MTISIPPPRRTRRLLAKILLFAGLALAAVQLFSKLPREQTLHFALDGPITRFDATFAPAGQTSPVGGFSLTFPERPARRVRHQVSLANGEYVFSVEVSSTSSQKSYTRRVSLSGGETLIRLTGSS
jgi:hypothetical protein